MHSLIMHRLLLGWPEGHLSLEASYGPVIWSSSLYVADHQQNPHSLWRRPEILRDLPQRGAPELARLLRNRRAGGRQLVATPVAQPSGGRTSTSGLPKRTSDRVITFMAADFT